MVWTKGQSGNPTGRPKTDKADLKPLLKKHGAEVLQIVVDAAKAGDLTACKMILERLYPAIKAQAKPVNVAIGDTLESTGENVIAEIMKGQVPPDIGSQLLNALSNQAKLSEITDLIERIEKLEQAQ